MTLPLLRRQATRPRRSILSVTDHWSVDRETRATRREVVIRDVDGQVRRAYLPDTHPALVAFLERAAVAA